MPDRAVHVIVHGHVQGVGFRAFVELEATMLDLSGWVRNVRDGSVEAVFSGDADAIEDMLAACRRGPPGSRVVEVAVSDAGVVAGDFEVRPTA